MKLDGNRHACGCGKYVTYNALPDWPEQCPICGGGELTRSRASFPVGLQVVSSYGEARCQDCGGPLVNFAASSLPVGEGSKQGVCTQCPRVTQFELRGQLAERGLLREEGAL
jgi:hypothetical protein